MKRFSLFAFVAAIVLCGFSSCEEIAMSGTSTYYGTVINEYTGTPYAGVEVSITNGYKSQVSTKTSSDGTFSIDVNISEINGDYYILIGNASIGTKRVEIPAFGNGQYNLGIISVAGPNVPSVLTLKAVAESKTRIYCEGEVSSINGEEVITRGFCWGISDPTIEDNIVKLGKGEGTFSYTIEVQDIHANNYYIRAYATNKIGTAYGAIIQVNHRNPYNLPVVEDISGKYIILPYDLPKGTMGGIKEGYSCLSFSGNTAYTSCENLAAYDYTDWTLPSRNILELMYQNKDKIGGFTEDVYWTSTYYGYDIAYNENDRVWYWGYWYYGIDFRNGETDVIYLRDCNVRPVRQY